MNDRLIFQSQIYSLLFHVSDILKNPDYKSLWDSHNKYSHFIDYFIDSLHVDLKKIFSESFHSSFQLHKSDDHQHHCSEAAPLSSVFQKISLNEYPVRSVDKNSCFIPLPLCIELDKNTPNRQANSEDFKNNAKLLISGFLNDLKKISSIKSLHTLVHTLYFLLYRYFSRISCISTVEHQGFSDISLFDKIRTYSAIHHANFTDNSRPPHILIKGDISGIQKFIYADIEYDTPGNTRGLSKQLRGRSFYIILLTEFIVSSLLRKFGLNLTNVIYSGGGHFLILLPNQNAMASRLDAFEKEMNEMLWKETYLRLSFNLSYVEAGNDVVHSVGDYIMKINHNLNSKKYKKNLNFLDKLFFDEIPVKEFNKDIKIGELLPKGNYLLEVYSTSSLPKDIVGKILLSFREFNTSYFLTESLDETNKILSNINDPHAEVFIYKINQTDLSKELEIIHKYPFEISLGFKFIANFAPKSKRGDVLNFEEISSLGLSLNEPLSYPLLSILRLDVDNLGTIFAFGFRENEKSLERISALSRELHLFFCGIMNKLAEKYNIYITYSGGDDAFFVGSWLNILHFASFLNDSFNAFHNHNSHLTFSAGIFTCHNKFPVAKFAEKAALAEKESKLKGKNSITVFDITLNWTSFKNMLNFGDDLLKCVQENENVKEKGKFSRALVHKLLRVIKSSFRSKENIEELDLHAFHRNITLLHYFFARHGFSIMEIEKNKNNLTYNMVNLILNNFSKKELIRNYTIPMQYVLFKTRTLKK